MTYEIIVGEVLTRGMHQHFEPYTVIAHENQTSISGEIVDQSALWGLISTIRDLHLTLVSINQII